jgi:2-polyprenyl-6-hydroxyphenyl methylase/3-demethylubiquinone-9 3-methyltransferase
MSSDEYAYHDAEPSWSNPYVWPPVLRVLDRVAPPPRRLLDLGSGNGATSRMLAEKGYSVVGVDSSESGVAHANASAPPNVKFVMASIDDQLASRVGTFPVVISLEVIEHCFSAREFMRVFRSLLEPGGIGIITTPYHGYLKNLAVVASGKFDHHFDPLWEHGHIKFFTIAKLRELFETSGFRRYEFHRIGRIPILAKSTLAVLWRD